MITFTCTNLNNSIKLIRANLPKGKDAKPEVYSRFICHDSSVAKNTAKKRTSTLCVEVLFSVRGDLLQWLCITQWI